MGGRGGAGGGKGGSGKGGSGGGGNSAATAVLDQRTGDMQTEYGRKAIAFALRMARQGSDSFDIAYQLGQNVKELAPRVMTFKRTGGRGLSQVDIFGAGHGGMSDAAKASARQSDLRTLRSAARAIRPPRPTA